MREKFTEQHLTDLVMNYIRYWEIHLKHRPNIPVFLQTELKTIADAVDGTKRWFGLRIINPLVLANSYSKNKEKTIRDLVETVNRDTNINFEITMLKENQSEHRYTPFIIEIRRSNKALKIIHIEGSDPLDPSLFMKFMHHSPKFAVGLVFTAGLLCLGIGLTGALGLLPISATAAFIFAGVGAGVTLLSEVGLAYGYVMKC